MHKQGFYFALLSALLFGVSPVACKAMVGHMSPALLAGLLYLGSGLGLSTSIFTQQTSVLNTLRALSRRQQWCLGGAIVSGGVLAPLLLAYGILNGTASEVSLLLNFEAVATTLIAWWLFQEHIGKLVWAGKVLIIGAAIFLVWTENGTIRFSIPGVSVLAACCFWGIDNNLTRELEDLSPSLLACLKGLTAGLINVLLAVVFFGGTATLLQISGVLLIGGLSYGLSLVLFILALREIGSARTSTLFASGPFIGAFLALLILQEQPPTGFWLASVVMLSGMFFIYGEKHRHWHAHEKMAHSHLHAHDAHHNHDHEVVVGRHSHYHEHEPLTHSHAHWPDIHHRHTHKF